MYQIAVNVEQSHWLLSSDDQVATAENLERYVVEGDTYHAYKHTSWLQGMKLCMQVVFGDV